MKKTSRKGGEAFKPKRSINDRGVIGNMSTLALVAKDGAIDYLCWENFDSPTIFAEILDQDKGGSFVLSPAFDNPRSLQMYLPETNILLTRWLCDEGSAEVVDFMPVSPDEEDAPARLIRRLSVTRGKVQFRLNCSPRLNYARDIPVVSKKDGSVVFSSKDKKTALRLSAPVSFRVEKGTALAEFELNAGERIDFILENNTGDLLSPGDTEILFDQTVDYWRSWTAQSTYKGLWQDQVTRSALVLKLLTSRKHGSILAAGTFGLPEEAGGERNWDYRATWIRDASFSLYALMRLGYQKEALDFYHWLSRRADKVKKDGRLRVMYTLDGEEAAEEEELEHLSGYGGAKPVRIGNGARDQIQLDIYGELLDSVYLSNKYAEAVSHDNWQSITRIVNYVCKNWKKPDAGIWEVRNKPKHFLHSRLMCWVAVDRAIRLASKRSLAAPFAEWIKTRNAIHDDIWENFWNDKLGHFVQSKGSKELDASMLLMPLMKFVSATDPKWLSTLDAIGEKLNDDGLVYRYLNDDGVPGEEGAFAACSFWYIECLARAGRLEEARVYFEKTLHFANHLHLYAEEFNLRGELMGNFPQAFTHLALISAAFHLNRKYNTPQTPWQD